MPPGRPHQQIPPQQMVVPNMARGYPRYPQQGQPQQQQPQPQQQQQQGPAPPREYMPRHPADVNAKPPVGSPYHPRVSSRRERERERSEHQPVINRSLTLKQVSNISIFLIIVHLLTYIFFFFFLFLFFSHFASRPFRAQPTILRRQGQANRRGPARAFSSRRSLTNRKAEREREEERRPEEKAKVGSILIFSNNSRMGKENKNS